MQTLDANIPEYRSNAPKNHILNAKNVNKQSYATQTIITNTRRSNMSSICKTGEKPGSGSYECTNCHTMVSLDQYDKLPPCPSCSNNEFTKQ